MNIIPGRTVSSFDVSAQHHAEFHDAHRRHFVVGATADADYASISMRTAYPSTDVYISHIDLLALIKLRDALNEHILRIEALRAKAVA